ncbi:hypothetical protein AYM40_10180 [Paraburkholderia phytofirmans OLGA172]|uniref:Uncharacterized protein n=1 Tax=Paraburkholderia phytofirmans OLGA172 TaxID=1417228 RepID=A0A160FKC4_9BURK|nr:hypothetical protein AYM40_10180 [Paraburkholderia phytofirmans OLGA172]
MVESIYSICIEADIFEWSQLERYKRPLRPNVATLISANVSFTKDCVEKVARGSECSVSWKTSIDGSDSS